MEETRQPTFHSTLTVSQIPSLLTSQWSLGHSIANTRTGVFAETSIHSVKNSDQIYTLVYGNDLPSHPLLRFKA
jgi:hypothetical protein